MDKIIFATGNQGKLREIRMILEGTGLEIISMKEAGVTGDIEENGTTFKENALIKAKAVCSMTGMPALADDSGLVIDALGGEPGIHSARYLGHDTSYDIKNNDLIRRLEGSRALCRTDGHLPRKLPWRDELGMRSAERTDLAMIRSSSFPNTDVRPQRSLPKRKTASATGERHYAP